MLPYKSSCSVYFVSVNVQSIFVSVIVLLLDVFYLNQLDAFYLNQATSLTRLLDGCGSYSIVSAEGDWAILRQFLSASRPGGWPYFDGCR